MAIAQHTLTPMERIELSPIQVVDIRWHRGRPVITATEALRTAGITGKGTYFPIEGTLEREGKYIAKVDPRGDDEPVPKGGIAISPEGNPNRGVSALTTRLEPDVVEALGYDIEAVKDNTSTPILVWAGDGHIAFDKRGSPDDLDLAPEQIADIRWHKERPAVTPTRALRAAGVSTRGHYDPIEDSIETYGMLVADVASRDEDEAAPAGTIPITPEGAGSGSDYNPSLTTRLPEEALDELGFDLEAVKADERPRVTVLAGDGKIAFRRTADPQTFQFPDRGPGDDYLSVDSREDLLHVWAQTDGDLGAAAEMFAVDEAVVEEKFIEAGLLDGK